MSRQQLFRDYVNERLAAVAAEIFSQYEKTFAEYQEELRRSQEKGAALAPRENKRKRKDVQQPHLPDPPQIKEEPGDQDYDATDSMFTVTSVESLCDPENCSQLPPSDQTPTLENTEGDSLPINTTEVKIKAESDVKDNEGVVHPTTCLSEEELAGEKEDEESAGQADGGAPALPSTPPPPEHPQMESQNPRHGAGKRRGEKRRLDCEEPEPVNRPIQPTPAVSAAAAVPMVAAVLPQAPSCRSSGLPPPVPTTPGGPKKPLRPCWACHVPQCGGKRRRYQPPKEKTVGSNQKIFTFCPATRKSTTTGFDGVVYTSFEHFVSVVDEELEKRRNKLK